MDQTANTKPTHDTLSQTTDRARRWNLAAVALAALTATGVALLPLSTSVSENGVTGETVTTHPSLLDNEGPGLIIILLVPVALVALPLLIRNERAARVTRIAIVVVLLVLVILGALSIGIFFVPTLVMMIASLVTDQARPSHVSRVNSYSTSPNSVPGSGSSNSR